MQITQKEIIIPISLLKLTAILPSEYFYRINKSVIVNMQHCENCMLGSRRSSVTMSDGEQFFISRRRYLAYQKAYEHFLQGDNPFKDIF